MKGDLRGQGHSPVWQYETQYEIYFAVYKFELVNKIKAMTNIKVFACGQRRHHITFNLPPRLFLIKSKRFRKQPPCFQIVCDVKQMTFLHWGAKGGGGNISDNPDHTKAMVPPALFNPKRELEKN